MLFRSNYRAAGATSVRGSGVRASRAGQQFGGGTGTGNYWDPHGEPQFLTKGANDERDNVDAVMRKEPSL